jgi:flagellar FliL protein
MADEPEATEKPEAAETADAAAAAAAPKKSKCGMIMLIVGVGAGLLGGVAGGLVVAPRVLAKRATATAQAKGEGEEHTKESKEGKNDKGGKDGEGAGKIVKLDNMIVNPAGSEGSRFLMVSVAFQVDDGAQEKLLREHEVELRDMAIGQLEGMTMTMLTQPFARDTLKAQLGQAVLKFLGPKANVRVFLPQFVIQ